MRQTHTYSPQELQELQAAVCSGAPLSELGARLQRPVGGIAAKLQALSRRDPGRWDPRLIGEIVRQRHNDNWTSPQREPAKVERSRQRVREHLAAHPDSKRRDLEHAGLGWDLLIGYSGRINAARRDLALPERPRGTRVSREQRRQRLAAYLAEHPAATSRDLEHMGYSRDLCVAYGNCMDAARRAAGVLPAGYVSAAEAARKLRVSREWISQLVGTGQLEGYRLGRRLYVRSAGVGHLKRPPPHDVVASPDASGRSNP